MSAHVLSNLLNELRKMMKCEACRVFYATTLIHSTIHAEARMLDSIYHMSLNYFEITSLA